MNVVWLLILEKLLNFISVLLWTSDGYLEPFQVSVTEVFCENDWLLVADYVCKKHRC